MLKEVEFVISLVCLLIGVVLVFQARHIVKTKMKSENENIAVTIVKVLGSIICVISLIAIWYIR